MEPNLAGTGMQKKHIITPLQATTCTAPGVNYHLWYGLSFFMGYVLIEKG